MFLTFWKKAWNIAEEQAISTSVERIYGKDKNNIRRIIWFRWDFLDIKYKNLIVKKIHNLNLIIEKICILIYNYIVKSL